MPKTANKVSFLIESQLPDFINEEYELFSKFIQKYYEQLEIQGQPLDIINNIQTYADIDYYEKNILNQTTTVDSFVTSTSDVITVVDTSSFPKSGYIKIEDEICFYKNKTATDFLEVSRGVSGNTKLGDLYSTSTFVTTQAADHLSGSTVQNISNLFLYALVKSFEKQYLADFPESYLKDGVDKRTLIKHISSFYQSKGTDSSVKFLFKCLIDTDKEPEVSYPRDHTLKASESNWIKNYSLKAKVLSGDVNTLIGKKITQTDGDYASAVVDNVRYSGKFDGEELYELILNEASVNGNFSIAARTKLTKEVDANIGIGDRIDVFSTMAWNKKGSFSLDDEVITYDSKNVNQFVVKTRTGTGAHPIGTSVTYGANVSGNGVELLVFGVLYNLENEVEAPYSNKNDRVEISESGFTTTDPRIVDSQNNIRWITSTGTAAIADLNPNVSAIFEDGEGYYIASSGFPSHAIGTLPSDAQDQKLLKIVRKHPISVTETYETQYRDVGIAMNGIPFMGYKDEDAILNGAIQKISVDTRGDGYKKPPYVLINNVPSLARAKLAGEVVESIIVDTPGDYTTVPTVDIVSGRNGKGTAVISNGVITSITIDNAGEYYSSPPEVRITDKAGKGRFADYIAEVSNTGQITGFVKINGGSLYTNENVIIDILPVGGKATATASIKEWRKDRYYKNQTSLDADNGYWFKNFDISLGQGYAYYASPTTLRANDTGVSHSPILGFAYDGNPIYGAYGYSDAVDSSSSVVRMVSSYSKNTSRIGGPSTTTYPIGTFINDWTYIDESGSLDANNGRYCVTPEFPEGTYAYFITVNSTGSPVFPYILGNNYYSLPLDSNYNSLISQDDIPVKAKRLRTPNIDNNGDLSIALIDDVKRGDIKSASIFNSGSNFSVGSKLVIDDSDTEGYGAAGEVDSVKGKNVVSINSQSTKVLYIELSSNAYLFDGDTITQSNTGATGTIVGDVFSSKNFALDSVSGTFSSTDVLSSSTKVISILVDKNSSYTKGAILSLSDGIAAPVAKGEVLEGTTAQNTVKIKVTDTGFSVSDSLFLTSSNLIDTTGSKIVAIGSLSDNLNIFRLHDNVALLTTSDEHGVAIGEGIDINIDPDDSTTETTYYVRKRIYQDIVLETPVISRVLRDTGVGRIAILNGGNDYTQGTYNDVVLTGGSGDGAKATLVVSSAGHINSVLITDKGSGYKKFDELGIGDSAAGKTNNNTPSLVLSVDHVGFSIQNPVLNIDNGNDIQKGDLLLINDEILLVDSTNGNAITVERAQNNTIRADHFDGTVVTVYDAGYNLSSGHSVNDGSITYYDSNTQKATVAWDYTETLDTIESVSLSTVFFDQEDSEGNKRLVKVSSISNPDIYFEISTDGTNFLRNPIIDVKKYYKYKFNTTHSSMVDCGFDFSPSINFNLISTETNRGMGFVDIKLGYGARISSNNYTERKESNFLQYYYYDRDGIVNSEKSYLNLSLDPLQGNKTAIYVTPTQILYSTSTKASHDGSGTIVYTSKSRFSVGEINSIKITNIGIDYKKIPIVTGIIDADGNIDNNVDCYLNSTNIGVPRNIKIINNGGSYHNDSTLTSSFTSNYVFTLSGFEEDSFKLGETVVQKSGSVEIARAKVTSWRKGSNIILVNKISGIFREKEQIIGLSRGKVATIESINYNQFSPVINTYYDNLGYYKSDHGKVSDSNQRITDSFYYQDYSYLIKSETPINTWRSLIKETTHPAGFKLFGEVIIDSSAQAKMSEDTKTSRVSVIQVWDPEKNNITVVNTRRQITQSIALMKNLNVEKGKGSVSIDTKNTAEIKANTFTLNGTFDGALSNKGNLSGTKEFNLIDGDGNVLKPYNEQSLVITLDGILQEPGISYTVVEDKITFAQPPLVGVTFHGRWFQFKDDSLNAKHLKKIKNIFQKNGRWIDAANQIEMNREFIQSETLGFIKNKYPEFTWGTTETKCYRDIGYIIDAFAHDIRFGGNQKTIANAEKYFTGGVLSSLTGDAILTDAATGDKTSELEAAVEAYEHAVGLAKKAVNNELTTGTFTTIDPYSNSNIILDSDPKCEDVLSALETLYGVLKTILNNGVGTIDVSYADYFDGENTIFELYYEDGNPVDTQVNEDLFIALSGVLQHNPAYTIDRTSVPNKVVFDSPPLWGQESNTKTLQEPIAVEKFFAHGVGSYIRCGINNAGISSKGSNGPFLILDSESEIKVISDPEFALVFIDGVLQRVNKSYTISGPTIKFNKNIFAGNNVEILVLYGRDIDPVITLYDYEKNQYYNEIILTCSSNSNDFSEWEKWYGETSDFFQVAYQKINGKKVFIGNVKSYEVYRGGGQLTVLDQITITISGGNPNMDDSNIFFAGMPDFSDEYELIGVDPAGVSVDIVRDDSNDYRMQRNSATWLYGTKRADEAFYERKRGGANIIAGDTIKIDGEDYYRTVNELPQYVTPKTYIAGDDPSQSFFGKVSTSLYAGDVRGVGLSVTCEVTNGSVTSISWNRTDFQLLYDTGVLKPSGAKDYYTTPILHFIPVDQQGGGARAEVVVSDGNVVDVVLTASGSGYTKAPFVVTARQYDIIKQRGRKIDSLLTLLIKSDLIKPSPVTISSEFSFEKRVELGPVEHDLDMKITTPDGAKQKITLILQKKIDLSPLPLVQSRLIWHGASYASVSNPTIQLGFQGTSIIELGHKVQCRKPFVYIDPIGRRIVDDGECPIGQYKLNGVCTDIGDLPPGEGIETVRFYNAGFVDLRRIDYKFSYHQGTLGPRFLQWEGAKFMSTGDIVSNAGYSVSAYTIQEWEGFDLQLQEFENNPNTMVADNAYLFNVGYPSINNYLSILDTADLPDANGAGYNATGEVIYTTTQYSVTEHPGTPQEQTVIRHIYPETGGKILIGKETISYTSKMSDRLLGCTRGVDGSPIEEHLIGTHIRNAL